MLSEEESLICCINYEGVIDLPRFLQVIKNLTNTVINGSYGLHIVSHESLIDINAKRLTWIWRPTLEECVRDRLVEVIPFCKLLFVHSSQKVLISYDRIERRIQL